MCGWGVGLLHQCRFFLGGGGEAEREYLGMSFEI